MKHHLSPLFIAILLILTACGDKPQQAMPLVEVIVDEVVSVPYKPKHSFVGRLEARQDVSIIAKVTGYLRARRFREGELVEKGELLYEIEADPFEAELAQAKADVARAEANRKVAELNYQRGNTLVGSGAISQSQMDDLNAKQLETTAALASAQASLMSAQVNLNYSTIHAPFAGRIGRSEFDVGDLVGPDFGALTTLVSVDHMQATFQVSERILMEAEQDRVVAAAEAKLANREAKKAIVYVELANNTLYPHQGVIDFVANRIDEKTGTIEVRALIPNPEGRLRPGQYVRVVVEVPDAANVLMIPQSAVQADQKGPYVLMVSQDGLVQRQDVQFDQRVGEKVVVMSGLKSGDLVIVRGVQKARPGQHVKVKVISRGPSADGTATNKGA